MSLGDWGRVGYPEERQEKETGQIGVPGKPC